MLDLMLLPLAAGLVILSIHAYFGLHVIARGVIFVDLAFAQIAALGTTVGLLLGLEAESPGALALALGATTLGALLFSFSRMEKGLVPQEAIIGIAYVVASAGVILLSSFTAEGAEHLKETLTGTLIWVGWPEVIRMAVVYAVLGGLHWLFRGRILATTFQPEGMQGFHLWDFMFY
ncbi:MAG: metal ABC transporter permease, partial [Gemmatimonadetes bacterium]